MRPARRICVRDPAARCARALRRLSLKRGSRECRMRAAPAVSCAKLCEETHTSIQVQRRQSGIPCAMALRLIARSPRRRIPFATVIGGLRYFVRPVGLEKPPPTLHQQRVPGPHGFAVRRNIVRPARDDRSRKTALRSTCAPDAAASTASHPNVSDDPDTSPRGG
jgi:hypothetical protein